MRNRFLRPTIAAALCLPILLLAPRNSTAQQTSGGSSYSVLNIGDLQTSTSVAGQGRGGVETAVPTGSVLNSINPALWSTMHNVTLQASMDFAQSKVTDGASSLYQNSTHIQGFSVAFPVSEEYGITPALAFRPYSTVNYRTQLQQYIVTGSDSTQALTTYQGSGGLSEVLLGTSFKPMEEIALGASLDWYFGSIENRSLVNFPNQSLNPATYFRNDQYSGLGGRIGLEVEPVSNLRLGAVYQTGSSLERVRYLINSYDDQGRQVIDTTNTITSTVKIPPRFTFGASYQMGRSILAADASVQSWTTEDFANTRNTGRYAVGYEYQPSESVNAEGFDRWTFRLGGFLENTYYSLPGGNVDQMGFTLGFGIPLTTFNRLNANTAIDVAFQVGTRGTTDNGLTQETFGRLSVELAISELWFTRLRR